MRIGLLQLGYETNSFAKGIAQLADLGDGDWFPGHQVVPFFEHKHAALSGAIHAIRQAGCEPVGLDLMTRAGSFNAGPPFRLQCLEKAMDHICDQLESLAEPLDGLYFAMHGAGAAIDCPDADSYFLQRLRKTLGNLPIMCSLDLHAVLTEQMITLSDGFFGIKEYPHTDYYEAGFLAASTLIKKLRGICNPKMALVKLPLLIPSHGGCTLSGIPMKIKNHFADFVIENALLDATFFHGFSGLDSAHSGASVLVVADEYEPVDHARKLANYVWQLRDGFSLPVYSGAQALDQALSLVKDGYVVINEGSDNPGGGSPGDGTHLLAELLARDLPGSIMGPVYDPEAAQLCHQHSIGDRFTLTVGGKTDPAFGPPISMTVTLLALSDGFFTCATPVHQGARMCYGPSARVRCAQVELILVSQRFQTYDDRPFLMTGANMADYRILCLKSMTHFRAYFEGIADGIITADTPSNYPADLRKIPYKKLKRPIYPLDMDTQWKDDTL